MCPRFVVIALVRHDRDLDDGRRPGSARATAGSATSHENRCSWSSRRRGYVARSQIMMNDRTPILADHPDRLRAAGCPAVPGTRRGTAPARRRQRHDASVLGEQEERELQAPVLGVGAEDDLGVGDRHVEGRAAELGERGDHEDHEHAGTAGTTFHRRSCASTIADHRRGAGLHHDGGRRSTSGSS